MDIHLQKEFIETEVPKAPPLYVSIYLMTQAAGVQCSAAEIAEKMAVPEGEVTRAWRYWQERGYGKENTSAIPRQRIRPSKRPDYAPAELAAYLRHQDIKNLFQSAERKLGRSLSHADMSTLFGLYDWLGMDLDLIDILLSYCCEKGKRGMHYIEQTAIGWLEEGIDTPEKAVSFLQMRKQGYREIMRTFGLSGRFPSPDEETFIQKWIQEYQFPIDVITQACSRTILRIGKVSFPYADKILTDWKKAGVRTIEDITKLDEAFAAKKTQQAQQAQQAQQTQQNQSKTAPPTRNRFINYTQREWDYEALERLEREKQKEW